MLYFPPGIHRQEQIELRSGQTLYLAPGAVVHGKVIARDAKNIAIRGRGILDGSIEGSRLNAVFPGLFRINEGLCAEQGAHYLVHEFVLNRHGSESAWAMATADQLRAWMPPNTPYY